MFEQDGMKTNSAVIRVMGVGGGGCNADLRSVEEDARHHVRGDCGPDRGGDGDAGGDGEQRTSGDIFRVGAGDTGRDDTDVHGGGDGNGDGQPVG